MKTSLQFWAAPAVVAFFLSGCASAPIPVARTGESAASEPVAASMIAVASAQSLDAAWLKPSDNVYRLGPGDKLEIEIVGDGPTRATSTVGPDGKIYYYLLPGIDVWGMTLAEARDRLSTELQKYVREKPVVAVALRGVESQRVWLLGRVGTPGVYTLNGPTTLLDALAQGGGLASSSRFAALAANLGINSPTASSPEAADLTHSFVIRQGRVLPVDFQKLVRDGDFSQNIYLQPDDFIYLPSAQVPEVYVLGAVAQPRSQKMPGSLSLVQSIALAGGTAPGALLGNVAVLRGSLTNPQIAIVNVDDVIHARAADVRLEPGDIVFVPFTPMRTLERYANLILDTFARTIGVNAGSHAAGGGTSVGISVSSR